MEWSGSFQISDNHLATDAALSHGLAGYKEYVLPSDIARSKDDKSPHSLQETRNRKRVTSGIANDSRCERGRRRGWGPTTVKCRGRPNRKISSARQNDSETPLCDCFSVSLDIMNQDFSCCLLDGMQKGVKIKVCPKHRYHKMACSMVSRKSLLTNVFKTWFIEMGKWGRNQMAPLSLHPGC